MGRIRLARFAAVAAGLALLAGLPAPCACLPEPAMSAHTCCEPPAGVSTAVPGCCPAALETAPQSVGAPGVPPATLPPLLVAGAVSSSASKAAGVAISSAHPTTSPPPPVRRL